MTEQNYKKRKVISREEYLEKERLRNLARRGYLLAKSKTRNDNNKEKRKETYNKNPEVVWEDNIKRRFKIDAEQYNQVFIEQNGCCKCCGKHQSELNRKLAIDHCHSTNKFRGLLCGNCNMALGLIKDSVETLEKMCEYLTK